MFILHAIPLCFAANVVMGRALRDAVDPGTLAFYRWGIASLILLSFSGRALWQYRAKLLRVLDLLLWLGFLGMLICGALFYAGLQQTKAVNGALIYMASPVIIILLEVAFRSVRLNVTRIAGIIVAIGGVMTILLLNSGDGLSGFEWQRGDVFCIIASISWALYSFTLKTERLSGFPTLVLFCAIALAGVATLLPFYLWEGGFAKSMEFPADTWFGIGIVAVIPSVFAYGFYQKGVALVGASTTSMYLYLMPVYAVLLAYLFLNESISYIHVIGFALVVCGLYFATQIPKSSASLERG
ncbi:MAG: DMT family transporter [Rhizobiaceae bacterium]|nr:DMT family transporter [Rhizobiaceae bacterium]